MVDKGKDVEEKDGDDDGGRNKHGDYSDVNADGNYGNLWSHDAGVSDTNSGDRWQWE